MTIQNAGTTCSSAPPIGRKISRPVKMPRMPIQRGTRPTRRALIMTAIMPTARASPATSET